MSRFLPLLFALALLGLPNTRAIGQDTLAPTSGASEEPSSSTEGMPSEGLPGGESLLVPPAEPTTPAVPTGPTGPTTAPGLPGPAATSGAPEQPTAPPVTVETGIAQLPVVLTPGAGRFAERPLKFRFTTSTGYDDNIFTTPDELPPLPTPTPTPQSVFKVRNPFFQRPTPTPLPTIPQGPINNGPKAPTPTPEPKFITIKVATPTPTPKIEQQERMGSLVTRFNGGANLALSSARTLFTMDLSGGVDYYWERPAPKDDYVGALDLAFSHKISPRMQLTGALSAVYQTNPDLSRINAPTRSGGGSYINTAGRLALNTNIAPRFSTVTSYTGNTNFFTKSSSQNDNIIDSTLGEEFRYLWTPRQTLAFEYRHGMTFRNDKNQNSSSDSLLLGLDTKWTSRLTSTLRFGEEFQTYASGTTSTQASPRVEAVLTYLYGHGSSVGWTAEYGLNNGATSSNSQTQTTFRTALGVSHVFNPRSVGSFSLNWTRNDTQSNAGNAADTVEDTLGAGLGYRYVLTPRSSVSLEYNYSKLISTNPFTDYYRDIVTLGLQHQF